MIMFIINTYAVEVRIVDSRVVWIDGVVLLLIVGRSPRLLGSPAGVHGIVAGLLQVRTRRIAVWVIRITAGSERTFAISCPNSWHEYKENTPVKDAEWFLKITIRTANFLNFSPHIHTHTHLCTHLRALRKS